MVEIWVLFPHLEFIEAVCYHIYLAHVCDNVLPKIRGLWLKNGYCFLISNL